MDGAAGFVVSAMNSYYVFLKFAKLWAIDHPTTRPRTADSHPSERPGAADTKR